MVLDVTHTLCEGCNKKIAISRTTRTADGFFCSICQANNRTDPVEEIEALNDDLERMGVKPGAPLVDEKPFGAWQADGGAQ